MKLVLICEQNCLPVKAKESTKFQENMYPVIRNKTNLAEQYYLPRIVLRVTSFEDKTSICCSFQTSRSAEILLDVNVGCPGGGKCACSLSNISTTAAMFGLCDAESWTQSTAMCMHLITSFWEDEPAIEGSSISIALPLSQRSHAWTGSEKKRKGNW